MFNRHYYFAHLIGFVNILFKTEERVFKGISYPFIAISILLLSICVGVVWRTPKDKIRVNNFAKIEPSKLKTDELPRMEKVISNFQLLKLIEIGLFIIGLICIIAFWKSPIVKGVGIGLLIQASIMFTFDTFAEKRGHTYLKYLQTTK